MSAPDPVRAPWSPDVVRRLAVLQARENYHPFTCKRHDDPDHRDDGRLVPTIRGFICPYCDYTQDWVPSFALARRPGEPFP